MIIIGLFLTAIVLLILILVMTTLRLILDIKTKRMLDTYGDDEINIHAKGLRRTKVKRKKSDKPKLKLIIGEKK